MEHEVFISGAASNGDYETDAEISCEISITTFDN
jgi:hypothetical protein